MTYRNTKRVARYAGIAWLLPLTLAALVLLFAAASPAFTSGPQGVPNAPEGLAAAAVHAGIVDLEWMDVEGADSYEVQVMPGNAWILLPGEGIDIALYGPGAIVRNLPHEGRYYFSVRARNGAGRSGWSSFLFQPATGARESWADVPEPVNLPATGVPAIEGVPSTGETLTADTSEIRDGNGLDRVKLSHQWIWQEGTQETDIEQATAPTYRLHPADEGRAVRLRVTFTDRGGFAESLTSAATATVAANSPPAGLPEISGTARVDETLTVKTSGISDADGLDGVRYRYQWLANDGAGDADIRNATAPSHTLSDADQGSTFRVRVTFTDDRGNGETLTSAPTAEVAHRPNTPATGLPTISGKLQVGKRLTADTSGIADVDGLGTVSYAHQWIAIDGTTATDIPGATTSTYTPVPAEEGRTIRVRVTFTDDSDYEETLTSEATGAIGPPNVPATGGPVIVGTAQVGETLTADLSGITDADGLVNAAFSFQWVRSHYGSNFSDIPGATNSTHILEKGDLRKTMSVRVSFSDDRGNRETLTSPRTVKVQIVACTASEDAPTATMVEIEAVPAVVESTTGDYFVLYLRPDLDSAREVPISVTLGQDGTTTLTDRLPPLPAEHYRVEKFLIAEPADVDGDCIDDVTELGDPAGLNPVNRAPTVYPRDGTVAIPDRATFELLSYKGRTVPFHGYLRDLEFLKFYISRVNSSRPMVYFINTNTHTLHPDFWRAVHGFGSQHSSSLLAGELVFHPNAVAPDGSLGVYRFEYKSWNGYRFEQISMINDALAASMPLLENNLAYHPRTEEMQRAYRQEQALFDASRVNVLLAEEILPDVPFLPLNVGQGYGFLRVMSLEERPDPRDVVIYETLPNELSRVAGIITTVPQTPLSHVNLRAVQDGVPNAFIRNALDGGDNGDGGHIDDLIGRYVYYAVGAGGYSIRAATRAEVDAHFASSRPSETQTPERDLTVTDIAPLSDLGFDDWNAFGVKAANVAVLRTLGFPEGTVPEGFAVPFYFYDEFMKHNGFYSDVEELLADPEFRSDFDTQEQELKKLRKKIKKGETPDWIIDALEDMHASYPEGQSLRYRSSTNNEDLPGFSGAGLYDSKTQDPEETAADGIDKSLKGVWASLWNFRAFVERDTHGVDHLATAMGVLVHPNYSGELANGVAVSFDPIHSTEGSYYVNTQLGEDLVTNPDANSVPEEILLDSSGSYTTLAASNQVAHGQLLMSDAQIDQLRQHLQVIHDHFEGLYNPEPGEAFAMEIEFKITSDDILSIKQARPWVFSVPNSAATGAPTISGTAQLGETLTASTSNIADADGLTNATFLYQWSRNDGNDGNDGADIEGAAEPSYTPSVSDVGKTIRVRASFTDDANNAETLTSAATEVVQPGGNAWSTTMTVGTRDGYTGYSHWGDPDLGSLSETAVEWDGKTHYVRYLFLKDGELWLGLNEEMLSTGFALSAGDEEFGSADAMVDHGGASYRFRWDDPGLGWSDGAEVTVNLVQSDQNTPALGAPTISGTAQVAETLTADTSGVEDADGLTNVSYSYQWLAGGSDIGGATGSGYTLTASEQGKTIQVRVTFTDDADNRESLTSVATVAVAAKPVPLTASFSNAPASHDGSAEFTFDLAFSENFPLSYITLRDHAFTEDGGDVKRAQRKVPGSNRTWTITVEPAGNGAVSITLPETTDCDDEGAICTFDKRKLSNATSVSISGPQ